MKPVDKFDRTPGRIRRALSDLAEPCAEHNFTVRETSTCKSVGR